MNHGTKFCRLCLKPLLPTILTSSLPFYPYQKDERALPGFLLTRCSFFPLRYKAPLAFPQMFSLYFYSYTILSDSLSLSASNQTWRIPIAIEPDLHSDMSSTLNMIYTAVTWSLELDGGTTPCQIWHNDHTSLTRSSGPRYCKLRGDYVGIKVEEALYCAHSHHRILLNLVCHVITDRHNLIPPNYLG